MLTIDIGPVLRLLADEYPEVFPESPVTPRPLDYITPNDQLTTAEIWAITDWNLRRMRGW